MKTTTESRAKMRESIDKTHRAGPKDNKLTIFSTLDMLELLLDDVDELVGILKDRIEERG